MTKLSESSKKSIINENNELSVLLWLMPGTYYFRFIVDGKEQIDDDRQVKFYQGIELLKFIKIYLIFFLDKLYNFITVDRPEKEKDTLSIKSHVSIEKKESGMSLENSNFLTTDRNIYGVNFNYKNTDIQQEPENYPGINFKNPTHDKTNKMEKFTMRSSTPSEILNEDVSQLEENSQINFNIENTPIEKQGELKNDKKENFISTGVYLKSNEKVINKRDNLCTEKSHNSHTINKLIMNEPRKKEIENLEILNVNSVKKKNLIFTNMPTITETVKQENIKKSINNIERNLDNSISVSLPECPQIEKEEISQKNIDLKLDTPEPPKIITIIQQQPSLNLQIVNHQENLHTVNHTITSEKSNFIIRNITLQKNLLKLKNSNLLNSLQTNPSQSQNYNNLTHFSKNHSAMNFLEISANFSINMENMAINNLESTTINPNIFYDSQIAEDYKNEINLNYGNEKEREILYKGNYILVYKLGTDFLVPMKLLHEDEESSFLRMRYLVLDEMHNVVRSQEDNELVESTEIIIKKDCIFYQTLAENSLYGVENLTNLDEFNELSVLKNIVTRFKNHQYFCMMNDIFIFFTNLKEDKFFQGSYYNLKHEFTEWLNLRIEEEEKNFLTNSKINYKINITERYENLKQSESLTGLISQKTQIPKSNLIIIKNKIFSKSNIGSPVNKNNYNQNKSAEFSNKHPYHFQFDLLLEIVKSKNYSLFSSYKNVFLKLFNFIEMFKLNTLLIFNFSEKYNNYASFQFLNLFPTQTIRNKLKTELVINCLNKNPYHQFNKQQNKQKKSIKNRIQMVIEKVDFDNLFANKYRKFFILTAQEMLLFINNKNQSPYHTATQSEKIETSSNEDEQQLYLIFSESILSILQEINMPNLFGIVFQLIILCYIFSNFKNVFSKNKVSKITSYQIVYEEMSKYFSPTVPMMTENLIFYSNLIIIFIYKFIFDLISKKFKENLIPNLKSFKNFNYLNNSYRGINIGLILSDPDFNNEDDMVLLNDILFNKISTLNNQDDQTNNNKLIVSKIFGFNFEENMSQFIKNLNHSLLTINFMNNVPYPNELSFVMYFEKLFDFKYFYDFYKSNQYVNSLNNPRFIKILDIINVSYKYSLSEFENLENSNLVIKQVWNFDFENLEEFFKVEENVIDFLQNYKFIEYANYFKKSIISRNNYFAEYSMKNFFNKFLPILEDIDKSYNPLKNYEESVNLFFKDLQKFEEFSEIFEVTKNTVKINFLNYSIMNKIMKNLFEEKTVIIQKNFKRKIIYNFVKYFKQQVLKLQLFWRRYYLNKISQYDFEKCFKLIGDKYKCIDPVILKVFSNWKKNLIKVNYNNLKLQAEIENLQRENQMIKLKYHIESEASQLSQSSTSSAKRNVSNNKLDNNKLISVNNSINSNISRKNFINNIQGNSGSKINSNLLVHTPVSNRSNLISKNQSGKPTPHSQCNQTNYNESFIDVKYLFLILFL